MQAVGHNPLNIQQLERSIVAKMQAKKKEHFGDASVTIDENDPRYDAVRGAIDQLVEQFPQADNGSRYIASFCTVAPALHVPYSQFKKILVQHVPGSLFLSEDGLKIEVGPLVHDVLGAFTAEDTTLRITNIRLSKEQVKPNKHAGLGRAKKVIAINNKTTYGAINTDSALQKTTLVADVSFGSHIKQKDMTLPIESYGDEETTEVVIPLKSFRAPIKHDGTVYLEENGTVFNIAELVPETVSWVGMEHKVKVPFDV